MVEITFVDQGKSAHFLDKHRNYAGPEEEAVYSIDTSQISLGGTINGTLGVKYDVGKPRMDLLPPLALTEVAKVLSFGALKYAPNNWKKIPDLQGRYTAAALRHITHHMSEYTAVDEESGIDTLAHAICCLMFKLEDKLEKASKG